MGGSDIPAVDRSAGQQDKVEAMQLLGGPVSVFGLSGLGFREHFGWGGR